MRILLSTDAAGGVWDHTLTLTRELDALGHRVFVAVVGELSTGRRAMLPPGVEHAARPYRLEWMPGAAEDVRAAGAWLRDLAAAWQADIAHLNQMSYATAGFPCPVLTAVHSDVCSWFGEVQGRGALPEWDDYRGWVRAGLGASDAVVAPSRYQTALTERHYGFAPAVIHNGAAALSDSPAPRIGTPVVLTAGRAWDEAKGVRVLDDALGRLGGDAPTAHLLGGVGTASEGATWSPRHLIAHGSVARAEVDAWMRRATVYAAPSLYEPFGLAPLEAALHGCVLLLSDIGSFRELWDGCAVFAPPGDAAALADALHHIIHMAPEERAQLALAARTRALRRFGARHMAQRYVEEYQTLLASRSAAAPHPAGFANAS